MARAVQQAQAEHARELVGGLGAMSGQQQDSTSASKPASPSSSSTPPPPIDPVLACLPGLCGWVGGDVEQEAMDARWAQRHAQLQQQANTVREGGREKQALCWLAGRPAPDGDAELLLLLCSPDSLTH